MKCCTLYTALVTPFKEGRLDEQGLKTLLLRQRQEGIDGVVLLGTTGEAPTLSGEEKKRILEIAKAELNNFPIMAGVGSPSTATAIEIAKMAEGEGADMLLAVTPYYNRPTQEGIFRHYEELSKHTNLPIVVYSASARTGVNINVETAKRLSDIPNIVGIKEASNNLCQIMEMISEIKAKRKEFAVLSGDEILTFSVMTMGGDGLIGSAVCNVFPKKMKALVSALENQDLLKARERHFELLPLFKALFAETNPICIKAALSYFNLPGGDLRLPLTPLSYEKQKELAEILKCYQM